jgi:hypothetical protein
MTIGSGRGSVEKVTVATRGIQICRRDRFGNRAILKNTLLFVELIEERKVGMRIALSD